MRRFFLPLFSLAALWMTCGCAASPQGPTQCWLACQGGIDPSISERARAEAALAQVAPDELQRPLSVRVLDSSDVGAYSWSDGSIFVTRGLIFLLDDEELTAAIAHELGHLVMERRGASVNTLQGSAAAPCAEAQADDAGVELLRRVGAPPRAMKAMLEKVAATARLHPADRQSLAARIRRLGAEAAPDPG
jgi:Zn-dependent protease with chaperone function